MNKQIHEKVKELAEQSGFHFYDLHNIDGQDLGETVEADSWSAIDKFAELIVKECAAVSENYAAGSMPLSISLAIKKHFGIE